MNLEVIFAYLAGVLAGLAVIGALMFVLVWEWCAIRRTLAAHRQQAAAAMSQQRGALVPTSPAEHEQIREGAHRVLAGESLRGIALNWRGRDRHEERRS
jgi:hypothetical protein